MFSSNGTKTISAEYEVCKTLKKGMDKGISPHAEACDIGDALVGAKGPKHPMVLTGNNHDEGWQMDDFSMVKVNL